MAEIITDPQVPQTRTRLPREIQSPFYIIVFIGLLFAFAGGASFFFLTPVFSYESSGFLSSLSLFALVMAIAAFFVRKMAAFLASKKGGFILLAVCVMGGIAPLLLLIPGAVLVAVVLSSLGILCILFQWWSHLCSLEHRMLVLLVSSSLLVGAALVLLLGLLGVGGQTGVILVSASLLLSTALLWFLDDGARDALYAMDSAGSLNRVRSKATRRLGDFSYFTVGLLASSVVELIVFLVPERTSSGVIAPAVLFAASALCVSAVCLFAHWRSDFDLERVSKDFLAFTCLIGLLPLPFLSGFVQFADLVYLLAVLGLQFTLIIVAVIELARFEEISPLWYLGEGVFLFGGMCLGSLLTKTCLFVMGAPESVVVVCSAAALFITFAQVLFNRFAYPEIDLFRSGESLDVSGVANEGECEEGLSQNDLLGEDEEGVHEEIKQTPRFRDRLNAIERAYGLSPRQCEILELLAKGRDTGYITEHFHISKSTAKTHIYNIYLKLEIHSRQELLDLIESDEMFGCPRG